MASKLAKRGQKVRRVASRVGGLARRAGGAVVRRARAHGQRPKLSHVAEAGISAATGAGLMALQVKRPELVNRLQVGPLNLGLMVGLAGAVLGTVVKPIANGKAGAAVRAAANAALSLGAAALVAEKMGPAAVAGDDEDVGFTDDED